MTITRVEFDARYDYSYNANNQDELASQVKELFKLDSLPDDFETKREYFEHFLAYRATKGTYQPNQYFLEHILKLISDGTYPFSNDELRMMERIFFDKFGQQPFVLSAVNKVAKTFEKERK